jgi:hypothetical protein
MNTQTIIEALENALNDIENEIKLEYEVTKEICLDLISRRHMIIYHLVNEQKALIEKLQTLNEYKKVG